MIKEIIIVALLTVIGTEHGFLIGELWKLLIGMEVAYIGLRVICTPYFSGLRRTLRGR